VIREHGGRAAPRVSGLPASVGKHDGRTLG